MIIIIRSGKREESNERLKYRLGRRLDKGRADLPIRDETPDPINSPLSFPPVFPLDRMFLSFFQSNVNRSFATLLSFFSIFSKIFNVVFEEVLISSARPSPRILAIVNRRDLIVAADGRRNRWTRSACTLNTSVLRDSSAPVQSCTQKV